MIVIRIQDPVLTKDRNGWLQFLLIMAPALFGTRVYPLAHLPDARRSHRLRRFLPIQAGFFPGEADRCYQDNGYPERTQYPS